MDVLRVALAGFSYATEFQSRFGEFKKLLETIWREGPGINLQSKLLGNTDEITR